MEYIYAKFGDDSSSGFSFRVHTYRQTDRQTVTDSTNHCTHASATGVHNNDGTSS